MVVGKEGDGESAITLERVKGERTKVYCTGPSYTFDGRMGSRAGW
jgi:hypothetical protein